LAAYRVAGQGGSRHETDGHSAGASVWRHFDGCSPGIRRWKGANLALQRTQCGAAISAQRARRIGLGLKLVLDRLRIVLRLGIGRLP